MTRRLGLVTILIGFFAALGAPVDAADKALIGQFAFDWLRDPNKTRCAKIDSHLASVLKSSKFNCENRSNTATQVPALICSGVDGKSEYMVFSALKLCENERKTQASNE